MAPRRARNQHKIDSSADAEAYIARLRDSQRVMNETVAVMRQQAAMGIVPPEMVFEPATADARSILQGAPFTAGEDNPLWADFQEKVNALAIADATLIPRIIVRVYSLELPSFI